MKGTFLSFFLNRATRFYEEKRTFKSLSLTNGDVHSDQHIRVKNKKKSPRRNGNVDSFWETRVSSKLYTVPRAIVESQLAIGIQRLNLLTKKKKRSKRTAHIREGKHELRTKQINAQTYTTLIIAYLLKKKGKRRNNEQCGFTDDPKRCKREKKRQQNAYTSQRSQPAETSS